MNVYKVHYENGLQEFVVAASEQVVSVLCTGVNQISNVVERVRVLEIPVAVEPVDVVPVPEPSKTEEQLADELLASVPSATAGESQ